MIKVFKIILWIFNSGSNWSNFFLGNNYNGVIAQPISEINIGNASSMASDTFFQLDDSIETTNYWLMKPSLPLAITITQKEKIYSAKYTMN